MTARWPDLSHAGMWTVGLCIPLLPATCLLPSLGFRVGLLSVGQEGW